MIDESLDSQHHDGGQPSRHILLCPDSPEDGDRTLQSIFTEKRISATLHQSIRNLPWQAVGGDSLDYLFDPKDSEQILGCMLSNG